MSGDLLAELKRAHARLMAGGPYLGAVIVVEWWKRGGLTLELTVDDVTDEGWGKLAAFAGPDAVEVAKRYAGRKVYVLGAGDFDRAFPVTTADPTTVADTSRLSGVPVHRVTEMSAFNYGWPE